MRSIAITMFLLLTAAGNAVAQRGELKPVPGKMSNQPFSVATSSGNRLIQLRETFLEGKAPDGKDVTGSVFILFDPITGCYFSYYARAYNSASSQIRSVTPERLIAYSDSARLSVFRVIGPTPIYVNEALGKAKNLEDAQDQAISAATYQLGPNNGDFFPGWARVPLDQLGDTFTYKKGYPISAPTRLLDVSRVDGYWVLLVENQWRTKIKLKDDFTIVDFTTVTKQ